MKPWKAPNSNHQDEFMTQWWERVAASLEEWVNENLYIKSTEATPKQDYGTPWKRDGAWIRDADGSIIIQEHQATVDQIAFIVACVNACAEKEKNNAVTSR